MNNTRSHLHPAWLFPLYWGPVWGSLLRQGSSVQVLAWRGVVLASLCYVTLGRVSSPLLWEVVTKGSLGSWRREQEGQWVRARCSWVSDE